MKVNLKIENSNYQGKVKKEASKVDIKPLSFLNRNITINKNRSRFKQSFFAELGVLLGSGLDIRSSLEIINDSQAKERDKIVISKIVQGILNGDSLSEALRAQNEFSQYDIQSVRIGEESGLIEVVLNDLSDYYSRRISQQRQIKSALSYPILVLLTTIVSLGFMLGYIVPIFEDVFSRFNTDLPALTRTIIRISRFTQDNSKYILVLTFLSVSLLFYLRKKEWVRRYSAIIVLKIPVIGKIVLLSYYVKFCQTLKLLSASKVHLIEAITLIRKMVRFYPLEKALMQVEKDITRGIPLSKAMESTQFFDKKMIALTRVGEEVNKLDSVYQQLLKQYSEDLETRVKAMNSLLEPVMIILVGCIVAIILVSMYLPIFKLGTGVF